MSPQERMLRDARLCVDGEDGCSGTDGEWRHEFRVRALLREDYYTPEGTFRVRTLSRTAILERGARARLCRGTLAERAWVPCLFLSAFAQGFDTVASQAARVP